MRGGKFTCRVNPFSRQDVRRRTIQLHMASPHGDGENEAPTRDELINAVLIDRTAMLAEILLRAQNIVRAYEVHGDKSYFRQQTNWNLAGRFIAI